jgi:hypothetical protein
MQSDPMKSIRPLHRSPKNTVNAIHRNSNRLISKKFASKMNRIRFIFETFPFFYQFEDCNSILIMMR